MKKLFIALAVYGLLTFTHATAQESKPKIIVTGIVKLDKAYKAKLEKTNKSAKKPKLAKDSAILNDAICFEGVRYTYNDKTSKITKRTDIEKNEFTSGVIKGAAYLEVLRVEKGTVYLKYRKNEFSDAILLKKKLKKSSK